MNRVLVTCPPMLGKLESFISYASNAGIELVPAQTKQVLSENELIDLLPKFDGWIIGDDPATASVFKAAKAGYLRCAVKWGVGVDNVDFEACRQLNIPITNTPNMFGNEVADLAMTYILALARQTHFIDRQIRTEFAWPKPSGVSLAGKHIGIIGFGDIGSNLVKRLSGFDVTAIVYDPFVGGNKGYDFVRRADSLNALASCDFIVVSCALTKENVHLLNDKAIRSFKPGVFIINVSRGKLIDEQSLIQALQDKHIAGAALDVFEEEPLPADSPLRKMPANIFGSHNGSNTHEAVSRASFKAIDLISEFFNDNK